MLTLVSLTTIVICASASAEELPTHAYVVDSAASLANVAGHDHIEKSNEEINHRLDVKGDAMTLMEGASVAANAKETTAASVMRREATQASDHASHHAGIASASTKESSQGKATAVSWSSCDNGECKCNGRRRMVIRYKREQVVGSFAVQKNTLTNWHVRSSARKNNGPTYSNTSVADFNKGFTVDANNLAACGGDVDFAKDCLVEPTACTFDTTDTNPYDAKAGEYCCSGTYQYCSYKCKEKEMFKCPTLTMDSNFPGGMDPAGPDVMKRCFMAQYPHGRNPEVATDADVDSVTDAD